ncbi:unnamed protein product [Caenorhabditis sp. 36 PRJEB53466]|nr:unnamed protein product [Caenorhabditis sp. 36 PRJEB53466]
MSGLNVSRVRKRRKSKRDSYFNPDGSVSYEVLANNWLNRNGPDCEETEVKNKVPKVPKIRVDENSVMTKIYGPNWRQYKPRSRSTSPLKSPSSRNVWNRVSFPLKR